MKKLTVLSAATVMLIGLTFTSCGPKGGAVQEGDKKTECHVKKDSCAAKKDTLKCKDAAKSCCKAEGDTTKCKVHGGV